MCYVCVGYVGYECARTRARTRPNSLVPEDSSSRQEPHQIICVCIERAGRQDELKSRLSLAMGPASEPRPATDAPPPRTRLLGPRSISKGRPSRRALHHGAAMTIQRRIRRRRTGVTGGCPNDNTVACQNWKHGRRHTMAASNLVLGGYAPRLKKRFCALGSKWWRMCPAASLSHAPAHTAAAVIDPRTDRTGWPRSKQYPAWGVCGVLL